MIKSLVTMSSLVFSTTLALGFSGPTAIKNLLPSSTETSQECLDFSGTWKGLCSEETENGIESKEETMTIVQHGCRSIEIDNGEVDYFGGNRISTTNSKSDTTTFTVLLDWNKEKAEINGLISMSGRSLSPHEYQYNFVGEGSVKMKKKDNKLFSSTTWEVNTKILNDESETKSSSKETCTYEKQSS